MSTRSRPRRHPHQLLMDWLDTDPAGQRRGGSVLVIGSQADGDAVVRALAPVVTVRVAGAAEFPRRSRFDLVVITDPAGLPPLAASAAAGDGLLADEGRVLVIVPLRENHRVAHGAPLAAAGLRLVSFDDFTEGPLAGPGRWLRAVYAPGTAKASALPAPAAETA